MDRLARTEHRTHCPFKGDASYFSLFPERTAENAVWSYEQPLRRNEHDQGAARVLSGQVRSHPRLPSERRAGSAQLHGMSGQQYSSAPARRAHGMDRARRHRAALPALLDGPHGAEPRAAGAQRGAQAQQRAVAVDRRHLRLPGRGFPDHHGHARRSHRPPQAADDRRHGVRRRLGARRVLHQRRDADRDARAARHCRRHARAFDAFADPQHVPRSAAAHHSPSASGSRAFRPAARSARWSAACCWSISGGARCSCSPCR